MIEDRFFEVAVQGEISNFRPAASGHLYFTLKDASASIGAVLFCREAMRLDFRPTDGMAVCAEGRLSVYEPRGQYQIVCNRLTRLGKGDLAQAFERLKARLFEEGLFDVTRKKPLPFLPSRIGLVTSLSGAALHDFLRVLHQRFPLPVLLAPSSVQGESAPRELITALRRLENSGLVDVIVLTRGGGSIEDLWAFNDEGLARAIAACRIPVVSAVGHEVDFTIADFVADLRCATPTDAAKTLAPVESDLRRDLRRQSQRLLSGVRSVLFEGRAQLHVLRGDLCDPRHSIAHHRLEFAERLDGLALEMKKRLGAETRRLSSFAGRLSREHPPARLMRSSIRLGALRETLSRLAASQKTARHLMLAEHWTRLRIASPAAHVREQRARLDRLEARLQRALREVLEMKSTAFRREIARLDALSPFAVLSRGYALAFQPSGKLLESATQVSPGDPIDLLLSDRSRIKARVEA